MAQKYRIESVKLNGVTMHFPQFRERSFRTLLWDVNRFNWSYVREVDGHFEFDNGDLGPGVFISPPIYEKKKAQRVLDRLKKYNGSPKEGVQISYKNYR